MRGPILVINAGSSSIKFSVFETLADRSLAAGAHGQVDGVGHGVVHSGMTYAEPVLIDDAVIAEPEALVQLGGGRRALFVYRIGRELGSLTAALGGIGEHAAEIRERVCRDAAWLGVAIDQAANAAGSLALRAAVPKSSPG